MKELFLKMENGNIPIEQEQIEKYNLKAGDISHCNRYHIVDKNGKENKGSTQKKKLTDHQLDEMMDDGVIFTPSESIDITQGVDS